MFNNFITDQTIKDKDSLNKVAIERCSEQEGYKYAKQMALNIVSNRALSCIHDHKSQKTIVEYDTRDVRIGSYQCEPVPLAVLTAGECIEGLTPAFKGNGATLCIGAIAPVIDFASCLTNEFTIYKERFWGDSIYCQHKY